MSPFRNLLCAALFAFASLAVADDFPSLDPPADPREFDPGRLLEWSRNPIRIPETYKEYKESFVRLRSKRYDSLSRALVDKEEAW